MPFTGRLDRTGPAIRVVPAPPRSRPSLPALSVQVDRCLLGFLSRVEGALFQDVVDVAVIFNAPRTQRGWRGTNEAGGVFTPRVRRKVSTTMSDVFIASSSVPSVPAWRAVDALSLGADGAHNVASSAVAEEMPIAFRYNGFAHAVMMATPEALADFAFGFSLTEGVIDSADDIVDLAIREQDEGLALDVTLTPAALHRYLAGRRVRRLSGNTSCGLCGAEDLRDVLRPAPRVRMSPAPRTDQLHLVLDALRAFQPLSRMTRGAHAAAWIGHDGTIKAVREDVGRHNALDKLIGTGLSGGFVATDGFCLITSRCSFEMVQKAVRAGYATLVSAAAPTALAIRTAQAAGLTLFALDRGRGQLLYTAPDAKEVSSCP